MEKNEKLHIAFFLRLMLPGASGLIPVSNYYSWFGISFMSSLLYDLLKIKTKVKLPEIYFTIQLIFFILLSLFI